MLVGAWGRQKLLLCLKSNSMTSWNNHAYFFPRILASQRKINIFLPQPVWQVYTLALEWGKSTRGSQKSGNRNQRHFHEMNGKGRKEQETHRKHQVNRKPALPVFLNGDKSNNSGVSEKQSGISKQTPPVLHRKLVFLATAEYRRILFFLGWEASRLFQNHSLLHFYVEVIVVTEPKLVSFTVPQGKETKVAPGTVLPLI